MTKYLLDTNIYINFYDRCYRFEHFPTFWQNLEDILNQHVVIPKIIMQESYQSQFFTDWITEHYTQQFINHKDYAEYWQQVIEHIANHDCYSDLALTNTQSWTNDNIADGWIIAIAKQDNLTIVTNETKNSNLNSNQPSKSAKIPDIAEDLGVRCIDMNEFFKEIELLI